MNDLSHPFKAPITDNKKAHFDSNEMDLVKLIASYQPATAEQRELETLHNLSQMMGNSKLIYIDDDITLDGKALSINGELITTANTVAVILFDEHYQPSNLAFYPLGNKAGKPFLLHSDGRVSAFIIGDNDGELIATDSLDDLIELYSSLGASERTNTPAYTLIAPFEKWQFDSMVKAFAKKSQITIFTDYAIRGKQEKTFKRDHVRLVATVVPIDELLLQMDITGILADTNTRIDNLGGYEWGKPEPLDSDSDTPATPYPIQAFTGVLRDAVEAIAYHAQVPTAMAGQCVLGALSTIGQRYINAPFGHKHIPVSLYLVTEGESGSGKSFASSLSHHSVKQWDKKAYQTFITLLKEWQADLMSLKGKERADYTKDTPTPKNPAMLVTDGTIEAVLDKFIIDELGDLSWTTDEAGQFFNGHSMKSDTAGNALSSLTKLWSDGEASRLRSQRGKNAIQQTNAYNVRLTLDIMGQRVILEPALTDPMMNGQGFLARSLIACPDSLQGSRIYNTPERINQSPYDDPRLTAYWFKCNTLLDPPPANLPAIDEITGKPLRINMPFGKGAMQALADFQQAIEGRQAKGRALEFLKAFASRMAENATRIATLMAFFDDCKAVEVSDLERAFLLVEYSTAERLRYLDVKTSEKNDSQKLIDWIVKQCKAKGVTRLSYAETQSKVSTRALRRKADFELAIGVLMDKGYIQIITKDNSRFIEVNPQAIK